MTSHPNPISGAGGTSHFVKRLLPLDWQLLVSAFYESAEISACSPNSLSPRTLLYHIWLLSIRLDSHRHHYVRRLRHKSVCRGGAYHGGEARWLLNPIDLVALAYPVADEEGHILTRARLPDVGVVDLH